MKNNFKLFQIVLLMCGVFSAGTDEVKTVSVMEGESVTLNPDLTKIPGINQMKWRFRDSRSVIAQIDLNDILYPTVPEMFKDRLKLDQTGSLTITNLKTKHSGLYKLEINHKSGTLHLDFSVTVYESPAVIDTFKGETKSVSETEGNPVSLQTDTETHGKELIVWRFGDDEKLIVKHDLEAKSPPLYDTEEKFRDRLKLDHQTGSLTITNTRITDSGVYKVKISSSKQTLHKRFTVTVSGLSRGDVAGIVVGVVLLVFSAAAAAGVFYHRHKVSELQKQMMKTVKEGDCVTLTPGIEINKDDQIQWLFGDEKKMTLIAEIQRGTGEITIPDGRFKERLKMDKNTGSLIITNTRPDDTGVYELRIRGGRRVQNLCSRLVQNLNKRFNVYVSDEVKSVTVMKGADVTLRVNPEIQTGDKIFWMFGDDNRLVAKNTKDKCEEGSEYSDVRFKPNVDLNRQTGDLTIKRIETDHTGEYKLKIIRNGKSSFKIFNVTVSAAGHQVNKSALKGRPVILNYKTEIQKDDEIQWNFEEKLIAEMTGKDRENPQWSDEFRGQMELDPRTGSLFIHRSRPEHSGLYKLEIKTSDYSTFRFFRIIVGDEEKLVPVMKGADVTLRVNPAKQTGDKIFWMFGHDNSPVAKNTEDKCEEESEYSDVRFKDKVYLNPQTGDLIIKTIRKINTGKYILKIIRNGNASFKIFRVFVSAAGRQVNKSVEKGCPVILNYDTEIQKDDKIQWKFEEKLIAEMTGENRENPQWSHEFRGQMKLDPQTGSLTIHQTTPEHAGLYKLEIITSDYSTFRIIVRIIVFDKLVSVLKGADVTLRVDPEIQTGDKKIFWMFGDENRLVAKNTEEKCEEESEYSDVRFKPNVDLNDQTGDLIIKKIETFHSGEYKLKIIRNGKASFKIFSVTVSVNKSVLKGRPVILNYDTDIQKDDKIQWKFEEKLIVKMTEENRLNPQWFADEFRDQMRLNPWTGSLTINRTRPEHSGLYKLEIKTSAYSTFRFFRTIVCDKLVSVMKGADVTLRVNPEIQTGDKIFWMFGHENCLVAKNTKDKCEEESECSDVRFKDKVDLNPQTGDLTIKKTETDHTGKYKLKIISNGNASFKIFSVTVSGQVNKSALKGDSVALICDTEIQKDDKIQWKFEEKLIAEMTGENREKPQWSDEFRDQMKLSPWTGSLIIQQTKPEHSGLYKLDIKTSDYSTSILFRLIVCDEVKSVSVMEGADVTLRVNPEIQTGDKIFWMFGDENSLVAKNTEEKCEEESEYSDVRFKDKVDLNRQTGDLTIKTIRTIHTGEYKLKIIRNGKSSFKIFNVTVSGQVNKSVLKGRPVALYSNAGIQKDDKIQWKFEKKLIAEMTGENRENPQWSDNEFRDQMKLDPRTGSLFIEETRPEHSGLYKLEINTSDYSTFRFFRIIVFAVTDEEKRKPLMKDSTEKRENESVTVEMPLLNAEDLDGVNEQESLL